MMKIIILSAVFNWISVKGFENPFFVCFIVIHILLSVPKFLELWLVFKWLCFYQQQDLIFNVDILILELKV